MPETPSYNPQERANLDSRVLSDAELITHYGGEHDEHGHLGLDPELQDQLSEEGNPQALATKVESEATATTAAAAAESTPEKPEMSKERLSQLMEKSLYGANFSGSGLTGIFHAGVGLIDRGTEMQVLKDLNHLDVTTPEDRMREGFNDLGVAEVVTLAFAASDPWRGGERPNLDYPSDYYVLQYRVLNGDQGKYKYSPGGDKREGNFFAYSLLLRGEEEAKELWQALQAQPELVRELGDMMVVSPNAKTREQYFGGHGSGVMSAQEWQKKFRPPYEKWKAVNGGVNRIAFRNSSTKPPEACTLIEF